MTTEVTKKSADPRSAINLTRHELNVLLVDDQAIVGEAVRRMLAAELDIHLYYCNDPTRALKMAEEVAPTVILQDLVMPDIEGLTLLKFFRAHPSFKDTPYCAVDKRGAADQGRSFFTRRE